MTTEINKKDNEWMKEGRKEGNLIERLTGTKKEGGKKRKNEVKDLKRDKKEEWKQRTKPGRNF